FALLPAPWRSVAPLVLIGFDLMPKMARSGYPMVMMLPFVILAVAGWARIGAPRPGVRRTRLGVRGWAGALGLGLAISTQPLAWFIAPFLVLGLLVVRAGDTRFRSAFLL